MADFHTPECASCPLFLSCQTGVLDKNKNNVAYCARCEQLHSLLVVEETERPPIGVHGVSYNWHRHRLGPRITSKLPEWCPRIPRKAKYKKGTGTHYVYWALSIRKPHPEDNKNYVFDIITEDCCE